MNVAVIGIGGRVGSRLEAEDVAIALVHELEHPRHRRERFTVGY